MTEDKSFIFKTENCDIGKRLDSYISEKLGISRSQIKHIKPAVYVNGSEKKLSYILKENESVVIEKINTNENESKIEPQNILLDIVYEDKYIIVINKKEGMSVHTSTSETTGTLVNALLYHIKDFDFRDKSRAGIIHRLDKDTSGIIVVGKNPSIVETIQTQFKNRTVDKIYHALVLGRVEKQKCLIDLPIGRHPKYRKKMCVREDGRKALTEYEVIAKYKSHTLLEIKLYTGRTHQIRVHLSYNAIPIAGDRVYSKSSNEYVRLMLHAKEIAFNHPVTNERMKFESDYPKSFTDILNNL